MFSLARGLRRLSARAVNDLYKPGIPLRACPTVPSQPCTRSPCVCTDKNTDAALAKHAEETWSWSDVEAAHAQHTLFTWTAHEAATKNALNIVKAEGIYFWDQHGNRYIDWNSMAMNMNHGHTPDKSVVDAIVKQLTELPYAYPGLFITEIRARLSKLLADVCPGDLNTFMFPSSGAEANEIAIRMARMMTGRHKIMSRYRSYHGATVATSALTGDQRRLPVEIGATGMIKFFDPFPYSFTYGQSEDEIVRNNLQQLREQILYEGPHTIAAIHIESVTGTNGILKPPRGYLEGIRELCTEYGILMVCDEVMAGFGRTGRLFGFCHAPSVVPDIVTFAKGVNGAFVPLGGVGVRDHVAAHFRKNNVAIGSTYNSHPVALASAYAALKYFFKANIIQNAASMETHLQQGMNKLLANHLSVKQARCVGLFGALDIQKNTRGDFIARVMDPLPAPMLEFRKALLQNGLFTMMRGHNVFCNPPLIINAEQISEGISILDKCLTILDNAMEKS